MKNEDQKKGDKTPAITYRNVYKDKPAVGLKRNETIMPPARSKVVPEAPKAQQVAEEASKVPAKKLQRYPVEAVKSPSNQQQPGPEFTIYPAVPETSAKRKGPGVPPKPSKQQQAVPGTSVNPVAPGANPGTSAEPQLAATVPVAAARPSKQEQAVSGTSVNPGTSAAPQENPKQGNDALLQFGQPMAAPRRAQHTAPGQQQTLQGKEPAKKPGLTEKRVPPPVATKLKR